MIQATDRKVSRTHGVITNGLGLLGILVGALILLSVPAASQADFRNLTAHLSIILIFALSGAGLLSAGGWLLGKQHPRASAWAIGAVDGLALLLGLLMAGNAFHWRTQRPDLHTYWTVQLIVSLGYVLMNGWGLWFILRRLRAEATNAKSKQTSP